MAECIHIKCEQNDVAIQNQNMAGKCIETFVILVLYDLFLVFMYAA